LKKIQRNLISVVTETEPFFIETSGSGDLSFRQAYAVESLEKVVQRRQSYFNGLHQPMDTKF
jgi:hypothetical protein